MSKLKKNNYMGWIILFLLSLILFIALFVLKVKIVFSEEKLKICVFHIPIIIKKGRKLKFFLNKISQKINRETFENNDRNMEILNHVKFEYLYINLYTIVNNNALFSTLNFFINSNLRYLYATIKNKFPHIDFQIKKSIKNDVFIEISMIVNLLSILFNFKKGVHDVRTSSK